MTPPPETTRRCPCFTVCPTHKAAPAMLDALKALLEDYEAILGDGIELKPPPLVVQARAAIAAAQAGEEEKGMKGSMPFDYCASCGGDLDTGWECNRCGRDWMPFATAPEWVRRFLAWWSR